ncbi:MAG TPA: DMT family transporter [Anaerolineae bacterium]|nr:DMT family transporter [Anaerolineae bacterium]
MILTKAWPYVLLLGVVWGTNVVAARFSLGQFTPVWFVGLRLGLAGVIMMVGYGWLGPRGWWRSKRLWGDSAVLGVMGTAVPMLAVVTSLQYQSSGMTSLLVTLGPAFIAVVAHFMLDDEKLNRAKTVGVLIALLGAVVMIGQGENGLPDVPTTPWGYLLVLLAIVCDAVSTIYTRKKMMTADIWAVTSVRLLVAGLLVMLLAVGSGPFAWEVVRWSGWLVMVYATLAATILAFVLVFYITRRFGATTFALTGYIVPLVATGMGILLLGESFSWGMGVGVGLILGGLVIVNRY